MESVWKGIKMGVESEVDKLDRAIMGLERGESIVYFTGKTGGHEMTKSDTERFKHVGRLIAAGFVTCAQQLVDRNFNEIGTYAYKAYRL